MSQLPKQQIARNRKAFYDYHILEKYEAGIALTGTEVKSLRFGKVSIVEAHADFIDGELYLLNCYIPEYEKANIFNHFPRRPRKLLLKKYEIKKLIGKKQIKGFTLVPLSLYFNQKNLAKCEIALAEGKKKYDKRQSIKEKEIKREKEKELKEKGWK